MTELLEQVIAKLKTLPASEQDAMAALILEELEDETRWDRAFEQSQHVLAFLAAEAMAEYQAGKTQPRLSRNSVKSRTTTKFRKAFADLPEQVQDQARSCLSSVQKRPLAFESSL